MAGSAGGGNGVAPFETSTQTSRWSELGKGNVPTSGNSGSASTGQNTPLSTMSSVTLGST